MRLTQTDGGSSSEKGLLGLACLFLLGAIACPFLGLPCIDPGEVVRGWMGNPSPAADEFFFRRIPRVVLGLLAGGGLAACGVALQTLLRERLAAPATLGLTGAAAAGTAAAMCVPRLWVTWGVFGTGQVFALAGTCVAVLIVRRTLALGLVASKAVTSGLCVWGCSLVVVAGLHAASPPHTTDAMAGWMAGGIPTTEYALLLPALPFLVPGLIILLLSTRTLTHLAWGVDQAQAYGVDTGRLSVRVYAASALIVAALVPLTGPVALVGLIGPAIARRWVGGDLGLLMPASFLAGGLALASLDALARLAGPSFPVGTLTAVVGCVLAVRWTAWPPAPVAGAAG